MIHMDTKATTRYVDGAWQELIVPALVDYVRIPNKSPAFDPDWVAHGHMEAAVQLMRAWAERHAPQDSRVEILRLPNRTPLLMVDVPGTVDDCVLMYGHLDKQPEFSGWSAGLGPWEPVIRDGKLYGRGGADDGYALFASLTAINALRAQKLPHARCVVLIEASEESGSPDLEHHIAALAERLGRPSLVVCLDAECGNYEQLWCTTSLRGNLIGTLRVDVLTRGRALGLGQRHRAVELPDPARAAGARRRRDRPAQCWSKNSTSPIPPERRQQAAAVAAVLGDTVAGKFPLVEGLRTVSNDPFELLLNSTWRATLSVTGVDGIPGARRRRQRAATLLRAQAVVPPAADRIGRIRDRRADAHVDGEPAVRCARALRRAERNGGLECAGTRAVARAVDHSAPRRSSLAATPCTWAPAAAFRSWACWVVKFPGVQFVVTGLLGPHSNAHGPNEFLHIATGRKLTACVASILADHASRADARRAA